MRCAQGWSSNCGGIIFWVSDYDNYYSLQVSTDGQAADLAPAARQVDQSGQLAELWSDSSGRQPGQRDTKRKIRGQPGAPVRERSAIERIDGQPPQGGSQVGLLACSPNDTSARVEYTNFVVSPPGGAGTAGSGVIAASGVVAVGGDCKATDKTQFQDAFKELGILVGDLGTTIT